MGRLLQLFAFLLILRFLWRAVARLLDGPAMRHVKNGSFNDRQPIYRGQMVRDPVCGVYIPETSSLRVRRDNRLYYFCSESCREAFSKSSIPVK